MKNAGGGEWGGRGGSNDASETSSVSLIIRQPRYLSASIIVSVLAFLDLTLESMMRSSSSSAAPRTSSSLAIASRSSPPRERERPSRPAPPARSPSAAARRRRAATRKARARARQPRLRARAEISAVLPLLPHHARLRRLPALTRGRLALAARAPRHLGRLRRDGDGVARLVHRRVAVRVQARDELVLHPVRGKPADLEQRRERLHVQAFQLRRLGEGPPVRSRANDRFARRRRRRLRGGGVGASPTVSAAPPRVVPRVHGHIPRRRRFSALGSVASSPDRRSSVDRRIAVAGASASPDPFFFPAASPLPSSSANSALARRRTSRGSAGTVPPDPPGAWTGRNSSATTRLARTTSARAAPARVRPIALTPAQLGAVARGAHPRGHARLHPRAAGDEGPRADLDVLLDGGGAGMTAPAPTRTWPARRTRLDTMASAPTSRSRAPRARRP